jgi:hypothetical protein
MKMMPTPILILGLSLEQWAYLATIFGFPALVASILYASRLDHRIGEQLSELKRIAQSQNAIALNTMLFNDPINARIIGAIETDMPILKEHKGRTLKAIQNISTAYENCSSC